MRQNLRRPGLYVVALALLLCTYTQTVRAADFGSIGGSPAVAQEGNERSEGIFIFTLKPGETGENGVRIDNNQKDERTVVIRVVDSIASNDGSFACRQDAEKKVGVSTWVKLEASQVTIPAGENKIVDFTVSVPKGASPGEHDACVTLQDTQNFAATKGAGIQLGFRIAIRLAVQVPGKIIKNLSIGGVQTSRSKGGGYTVTPVARNTGNVSLDVKGRAQLFSIFGQQSEVVNQTYTVMQGALLKRPYDFKPIFWGGFYKAKLSLGYNANVADGIGAESGGQTKRVSTETKYFFVMPDTRALVAELAIPVFGIAGLCMWLRRRHRRRTAHKRMKQYVVQPGDTIMSVAKTHNVKWKRLASANGIKAPYMIQANQTLLVPNLKAKHSKLRKPAQDQWVVEAAPTEAQAPTDGERIQNTAQQPSGGQTETVVKYVYVNVPQKPKKRGKGKYDWAQPAIYYGEPQEPSKPKRKQTTVTKKRIASQPKRATKPKKGS